MICMSLPIGFLVEPIKLRDGCSHFLLTSRTAVEYRAIGGSANDVLLISVSKGIVNGWY